MARKKRYQTVLPKPEGGQWKLRYRDTAGVKRVKCFGPTKTTTRPDALRAANSFMAEVNRLSGQGLERHSWTVRDVVERWREVVKPAIQRPSTVRNSEWVFGRLSDPDGGIIDCDLAILGRSDIQEWLIAHSPDYAPRTLHLMKAVFSGLLSYAVDWGWVLHNPAHGRYRMLPKVQKKQRPRFLPQHASRLVRFLDPELKAVFLVTLLTGARKSEVAALRASDVRPASELGNYVVTISRKWDFNAKPERFGPTKGGRVVDVQVGELVWGTVRQWLAVRPTQGDLLFPSPRNLERPRDLEALLAKLKAACRQAGVPEVTWHDLRSCYTSWCVGAGVNPKVVQAQIGHSSVLMTLDVYAQLAGRGDVAQKVEGLLNVPPQSPPSGSQLIQ